MQGAISKVSILCALVVCLLVLFITQTEGQFNVRSPRTYGHARRFQMANSRITRQPGPSPWILWYRTNLSKEIEREEKERQCLLNGSACNPWKDRCCPGMKCVNYATGYCLHGVEKCVCFPTVQHDVY